jgi:hypothetical protein
VIFVSSEVAGISPLARNIRLSPSPPILGLPADVVTSPTARANSSARLKTLKGKPRKAQMSMGAQNVAKAIDIYRGTDPDKVLSGHKVRSFYNNISDPENEQGKDDGYRRHAHGRGGYGLSRHCVRSNPQADV